MSKEEDQLPTSTGLGDALDGLFRQGRRIANTSDIPVDQKMEQAVTKQPIPDTQLPDTEESDKRIQDWYMESFMKDAIPQNPLLSMREEVEHTCRIFPQWNEAFADEVPQRKWRS